MTQQVKETDVLKSSQKKKSVCFCEIKSTGLRRVRFVWTSKLSKHKIGVKQEAIIGYTNSCHFNKSRLEMAF